MIVVLMGVAGCGKSTVGRALAERTGWAFVEGDDFHPPASRERMAAGVPLTDADRGPWLDALGAEIARRRREGSGAVLACSALKRAYRDRLRRHCPGLRLVHLTAAQDRIAERLARRRGHYMPASLLASQVATLEPPQQDEDALVVEAQGPAEELARRIVDALPADGGAPAR